MKFQSQFMNTNESSNLCGYFFFLISATAIRVEENPYAVNFQYNDHLDAQAKFVMTKCLCNGGVLYEIYNLMKYIKIIFS